ILPVIFRAKIRHAIERAGLAAQIDPAVWKQRWRVHVKPIGNGQHAALYLSRYIYRVALANQRIEGFQNGRVTFRYTHARTGQTRRLTLPVDLFIARFLQHVLPAGFTKVRSYGLMSPASNPNREGAPFPRPAAPPLPSPTDRAPLVASAALQGLVPRARCERRVAARGHGATTAD